MLSIICVFLAFTVAASSEATTKTITTTTTTEYTTTESGTVVVQTMLQPVHQVVVQEAAGTVTEHANVAAETVTSTVTTGAPTPSTHDEAKRDKEL